MKILTLIFSFFITLAAYGQPSEPAPNPERDSAQVISLFSDDYNNVPVDTWRTEWSQAELEDIEIQNNPTKRYTNLDFVGIETVSNQINISAMNHVHLDIWTPNMTTFRLKLVDFGPNGAFDGPGNGDDTEGEVIIENPTQGQWISLDIPLTSFPTMTGRTHLAQIILSGLPVAQGTVYVDNIYFYFQEISTSEPMTAAPTPNREASSVISLFSDAYSNVTVDTWRTEWSQAELEDIEIQNNPTKKYTNLDFAGIETVSSQVDISTMNHVHMDIWTPNMTTFRLKLVDFGPNGTFDGPGNGDDTEGEIIIENPAQGQWISLDIPLSDFPTMTGRANLAQIILSGLPVAQGTVYVDNVYFYFEQPAPTEPMMAAPTPNRDAIGVISLFSDAYSDVTVDTWRTEWSQAELEDIEIQNNPTKKYTNLDFVGIETVSNLVDISVMTHVHLDIWTPNMTTFRLKLVDFGPNGAFDGPGSGDDTEGEVIFENPTQSQWISLDIPLSDFPTMTGRANLAQIILSGLPVAQGTVYVDNVYFYFEQPAPTEPMMAAPTPNRDAIGVISLFSDAYSDVTVDTWRTEWSQAELEDIEIQNNPTKKYTNLDFVGIETVSNLVDISVMTHVHLDIWTPNMTTFRLKLVDFGPNGAFDGPGSGDDTEGEVIFENPTQSQWISLDIPLSDFPTMTGRANLAQIILSGLPVAQGTVYVDNVYFYDVATSTHDGNFAIEAPKVYPNPVNSGQVINLIGQLDQYELFDISGQARLKGSNQMIDTSLLENGIYFIKILNKNGQMFTEKIIIH